MSDARKDGRWSVTALAALLYPFAAAAVAINLYMAALVVQVVGLAPLTPVAALLAAIPLGIPAAWLCGRWVRRLIDEADGKP